MQSLRDMPMKIGGYPVVAVACHPICYTIMVHREGDSMPFVVASWMKSLGPNEWTWGHYFDSREDALEDFYQTSSRNEERT
ncbi:hypothetical protein IB276_22555 [Ensifer sp. ENS04]|uniref:hypothetical protein n=1 Tax=Ensifer sp. ENS04 TaxID=2769281 RepID=UPI00177AEE30|nr:hypothetical protein [Ensifer sp. ENS04]MBD9542230.1 hypothetical protein [Ensifer sp. ENS04]